MEYYGRLIGVLEENLIRNVEDDGKDDKSNEGDSNLGCYSELLKGLLERLNGLLKNTHCGERREVIKVR